MLDYVPRRKEPLDELRETNLVGGNLGTEYLGKIFLQSRVDGLLRVDFTHWQVDRGLLRDEDVDAVVCFLPDEDDGAEEEALVRPEGGDGGVVPGLGPGPAVRGVVLPPPLDQGQHVPGP